MCRPVASFKFKINGQLFGREPHIVITLQKQKPARTYHLAVRYLMLYMYLQELCDQ